MTLHILKIKSIYLDEIIGGKKKFEVRQKDRDFKVGDFLRLNEIVFDGERWNIGPRFVICQITSILDDEDYCKKDMVIMSIELIDSSVSIYRQLT